MRTGKLKLPDGKTVQITGDAPAAGEVLVAKSATEAEFGSAGKVTLTATALTDNTGGTANGTLAALGGITTLTDSSGLAGSHDDTIAAMTTQSDLTGGEPPTEAEYNTLLAEVRVMAQNISDLAQKVIELDAAINAARDNFADFAVKYNTLIADLTT